MRIAARKCRVGRVGEWGWRGLGSGVEVRSWIGGIGVWGVELGGVGKVWVGRVGVGKVWVGRVGVGKVWVRGVGVPDRDTTLLSTLTNSPGLSQISPHTSSLPRIVPDFSPHFPAPPPLLSQHQP